MLEIRSLFSSELSKADLICERAALLQLASLDKNKITRLGGIHKLAAPIAKVNATGEEARLSSFLDATLASYDQVSNVSLSAYCQENVPKRYEDLLSQVLPAVRKAGFRKANLLRPKGHELTAREVMLRRALDFVHVHSGNDDLIGPTIYVPNQETSRRRETEKPVPSSQISLSSKLARTLVNLTGLSRGQTLLDPFCGSGTILSEGALLQLNCIGLDSNPNRVAQTKQNLIWLERDSGRKFSYEISIGDARNLEGLLGRNVGGVATEPILLPKLDSTPSLGRAKKMIKAASRIYSDALYSIGNRLNSGGRLVIVVPVLRTRDGSGVSVEIEGMERAGLKEYQPNRVKVEYPIRVGFQSTRWLKRAVYVFERM